MSDKDFWQKDRFDKDGDFDDDKIPPGERAWDLTPARRQLLEFMEAQDWVEADAGVAAPWTFVCCHHAGWLEKDRRFGKLRYRITDEGLIKLSESRFG